MSPRPIRKKVSTTATVVPDRDQPLSYWRSLPKEVLVLACNKHHLVDTGSIAILARRLYDFHQNRPVVPPVLSRPPPPNSIIVPSINTPLTIPPPPPIAPLVPTTSSTSSNNLSTVPDAASIADLVVQRLLSSLSSPLRTDITPSVVPDVPPIIDIVNNGPISGPPPQHRDNFQHGARAVNDLLPPPLSTPLQPATARCGLQNPSAMLPAIPANIREQIRHGEFVNFNSLLPSSAPITTDDYTIQIDPGSGIHNASLSLVPRHQVRPKIRSFTDWLTAWNNFIRCASHYHPHLTSQYLYYQTMICQFASQYEFSAWSTYDQLFRARLVNNPSMSWDQMDEELYNRYIRGGALLAVCFNCRNFGHYVANCPLRASNRSQHTPASSTNISSNMPPFHAPQRSSQSAATTRVCHFFNNRGQCHNEQCPFAHQCSTCYGDHPHTHCNKRKFIKR